MITTVTLNPALDKTIHIAKLVPNDANRVIKLELDAGGKGINCSRMLHALGAQTRAIAFLGGKPGELIRMVLDKEGIILDAVPTSKPTRTVIAIEDSSEFPPTTLNEQGGPVEHSELVTMLEKAKDAARESSFMLFGGSVPIGVNRDVYRVLIQIAVAGGAKAVLDTDGEALAEGIKSKPFMIKPNLDETERLLGKSFDSKSDVARAAIEISEMGIELVVISLGKQGSIAHYNGMIFDVIPPKIKSLSTIGSGDSMIAGVIYALEQKMDIEDALRLGSAAGAATALSNGSQIGCRSDVDTLLDQVKITRLEPAAKV